MSGAGNTFPAPSVELPPSHRDSARWARHGGGEAGNGGLPACPPAAGPSCPAGSPEAEVKWDADDADAAAAAARASEEAAASVVAPAPSVDGAAARRAAPSFPCGQGPLLELAEAVAPPCATGACCGRWSSGGRSLGSHSRRRRARTR